MRNFGTVYNKNNGRPNIYKKKVIFIPNSANITPQILDFLTGRRGGWANLLPKYKTLVWLHSKITYYICKKAHV